MGLQDEKDADTRRRVLDAARTVFARDGFLQARIADVAKAAGVGMSRFYRQFPTKTELFVCLYTEMIDATYVKLLLQESLAQPFTGASPPADPVGVIRSAVRRIIVSYRADHVLIDIMEQLAASQEEFRTLYLQLRGQSIEALAEFVEAAQRQGAADPALDPILTGRALLSQISHSCHMWFALREPYDEDAAVETITKLWVGGLGLTDPRKRQQISG